jgi:hypothetical protein
MGDHYGYQSAKEANAILSRQRDSYRYTTEPLLKINDTLKDILTELRKLNENINDSSQSTVDKVAGLHDKIVRIVSGYND